MPSALAVSGEVAQKQLPVLLSMHVKLLPVRTYGADLSSLSLLGCKYVNLAWS